MSSVFQDLNSSPWSSLKLPLFFREGCLLHRYIPSSALPLFPFVFLFSLLLSLFYSFLSTTLRFGDLHAASTLLSSQTTSSSRNSHYIDPYLGAAGSHGQHLHHHHYREERHYDLTKHGVTITPISNSAAGESPADPARALDLSNPWGSASASG